MGWFSLSLLCALSLATSDALAKKFLSSYSAWQLLLIRFFIPGVLLIPVVLYLPVPTLPDHFWFWISILMPLEIFAMILYMQAIRDAGLSQTLPYLSFTPVFNIATGWIILGEHLSISGITGVCLVVAGAYLLNLEHTQGNLKNWFLPIRAIFYQQGARRMLLAALIYSFTSVGGKAAMNGIDPVTFGALYFIILGSITLVIVSILRPKEIRILAKNPLPHFAVGGLMALMVVTHFVALSMVEVAYMISVKRTSLLFGILYGAWLFREQDISKNLISSVIMIIGVTIILLT